MKMMDQKDELSSTTSRREFLKISAGVSAGAAAAAVGVLKPNMALADDFSPSDFDPSISPPLTANRRAGAAYQLKEQAARQHLRDTFELGTQLDNNDEQRYAAENYYASFTKTLPTLPSDRFGEVDPSAFEALQTAMRSGAQTDFDNIPLDVEADRTLANPQGAFRYELTGLDGHATRMPPSLRFRGARLAAEMGEVYWQALTRDIPFIRYASSRLIEDAVQDLNSFSRTAGPKEFGQVTPGTLFRGETPGDLIGPYISQFLWLDFSFGPVEVKQRYETGVAGLDFMIDEDNWLNIQRGGAPIESAVFAQRKKYIFNNRSLAEYVHRDVLYQAYLHAALILLGFGPEALDEGNPYRDQIRNQGAFTSLGAPFVIDMVSKAGNLALSGAWFQKWRVHRFLRPEAYAGRVHFHSNGQRTYELHPDILDSAAVAEVYGQNGTYFLPQAYIEGSPTHPSYPAGHGAVAGACVTVLKALFNESYIIENPVEANARGNRLIPYAGSDELTVGGELNKLANNVAIGRDAAGVHYRQDGVEGLVTGEQQAIAMLQDQSRTLNESNFGGFRFTKFDGTPVVIEKGEVFL
jgi:hypothetical protein